VKDVVPDGYLRVTITGKKRDPKSGDVLKWSYILSEKVAKETCAAWRKKRHKVEVSKGREP
jgi:hypothetical protein